MIDDDCMFWKVNEITIFHLQQMLLEKLEAVHSSKQMYKEKWAILVRDVQKVRYENESVSNNNSKYRKLLGLC